MWPILEIENDGDRVTLLGGLDNCKTLDDISKITHKLLYFGIYPF